MRLLPNDEYFGLSCQMIMFPKHSNDLQHLFGICKVDSSDKPGFIKVNNIPNILSYQAWASGEQPNPCGGGAWRYYR